MDVPESSIASRRPPRWLLVAGAAGLALAVGVAAVVVASTGGGDATATPSSSTLSPNSPQSATGEPAPTLKQMVASAVPIDASGDACAGLTHVVRENNASAEQQRADAQIADGRAARMFVQAHPWARQTPRNFQRLGIALGNYLRDRAHAATGRRDPRAREAYVKVFVSACGLSDDVEAARHLARTADNAIYQLQHRAANAPWYPLGYIEATDGVAYQPLTPGSYSCGLVPCLKLRVVTQHGCGTLYIEEKVADSAGEVVDWTNDMLVGLDPGQVGLMTFDATVDMSGLRYQMSQVDCY